jgi:hypothetical protein
MVQIARNLSDAEDGFLRRKKFLIMDRDAKFCEEFRATLEQVGIEAVRLPPRSPNLTPHIERFMRSLKTSAHHRRSGRVPRATRRHPAVLPPRSGLTWSATRRRAPCSMIAEGVRRLQFTSPSPIEEPYVLPN